MKNKGELWDTRRCVTARLMDFTISFEPIGSGNPNRWRVLGTASFMGLDREGEPLGVKQSSSSLNAQVPYFVIAEELVNCPNHEKIMELFFASKKRLDVWVAQQIYNMTKKRQKGFVVKKGIIFKEA